MTDEVQTTEAQPTTEGDLATQTLEQAAAQAPNYFRDLAAQMIREGKVNDTTTIADAKQFLIDHHAPAQQ